MIWLFERRGAHLRCETRKTPEGTYELVVTDEHGTERVERFDSPAALARRQVDVEQQLADEGWSFGV